MMKAAMLLCGSDGNPSGSTARAVRLGAAVLWAVLAAGAPAWAAGPNGPTGPTGPVGPVGPVGPTGAARGTPAHPMPGHQHPASPAPQAIAPSQPSASAANAGPAGNRIEVSGNTATGTRCTDDGATSVNSVDVTGARLDGRTVIVQGRNTHGARTRDCPRRAEPTVQGEGAARQTQGNSNSIRIR